MKAIAVRGIAVRRHAVVDGFFGPIIIGTTLKTRKTMPTEKTRSCTFNNRLSIEKVLGAGLGVEPRVLPYDGSVLQLH